MQLLTFVCLMGVDIQMARMMQGVLSLKWRFALKNKDCECKKTAAFHWRLVVKIDTRRVKHKQIWYTARKPPKVMTTTIIVPTLTFEAGC